MEEHRGYRLVQDNMAMVKIMNLGKGMVPLDLRGDFTNKNLAKTAIDIYLETKGIKDGKPNLGGRD